LSNIVLYANVSKLVTFESLVLGVYEYVVGW